MHYAVVHQAGWPLHGPPPRELIGPVPRPVILSYLADELIWGLEHASEAYAVLNACRALLFAADGRIVSKIDGGQTALIHGAPTSLIHAAATTRRQAAPASPAPSASPAPPSGPRSAGTP
jgi:hypothetical protein